MAAIHSPAHSPAQAPAQAPVPELLKPTTLRELVGWPGPCITVLLSPDHNGEGSGARRAYVKSSVLAAEQQLAQRGCPKTARANLLAPLEQLAVDPLFAGCSAWSEVIFASPGVFRQFSLTQPVKARLIAGGSFSVRQLVAELERPRVFYVLSLSKSQVALMRCAGLHSEMIKPPAGVPDRGAENQSEFYRLVDRGLQQLLHEPWTPLILAGGAEDLAVYRAGSVYRDLIPESMAGSAGKALEQTETLQQAYCILRADHHRREAAALLAAKERTAPGRLSTDADTILHAAFEGRVSQLYVNERAERIDMFERGSYQSWGSEDLYNLAAVQTILHHGKACFLPANLMPNREMAAAFMRF